MEKEPQPDSMSAVTIKPEYAASEVYSSEPPPAYHKPQSSAVQIAKIVAATVVLCSIILGGFLLASAYVTANASCRALEQELEILSDAADRYQSPVPQPEALIQDEPTHTKRHTGVEEASKNTKEIEHNNIDTDSEQDSSSSSDGSDSNSSADSSSESEEDEDRTPIHIKLPLQLDMDDLAGAILDKNQRSKMNCIVEKKKAEEIVDHQPKTIRLPFGVNVTTNPRFERLSGERMVIICESGTLQRAEPQPQPESQENDDDQEEDTIMIQPVMIPIPNTPFRTHMPQQMAPAMVQRIVMVPQPQQEDMNMRPPMMRPPGPPMHPMETMRPPMPPMVRAQIQMQVPPQNQPTPQQPQSDFPPSPVLHHIIQQIIAQKIMETQRAREEQLRQMQMQQQQHRQEEQQQMESQQSRQEASAEDSEEPRMIPHRFQMQPQMMQRLPIPEEVLTQLNRLPNRNVIVAVQESDSSEETSAPQDVRFVQEPRQSAAEMNGRQAFAPVNIPVAMMPHPEPEQEQEPQEPQAAESEEARPHYVQPRSVRSVDNPLKDAKRIKRCACDCAC